MKTKIIKPVIFILVGMMLAVSLFAGCSTSTTTKDQPQTSTSAKASTSTEVIKLRMGGAGTSATHPLNVCNQKWIEKIQNETNGRVQITLFPGGTLIDMLGAWDQLLAGVADISLITPIVPGAPFPITAALPTFCYDTDLSTDRYVFYELWKEFPELRAEYTDAVFLFNYGETEGFIITKKSPVRTLADFKGLQLMPPIGLDVLLTKLGATAVMLPSAGEAYVSLDKGIVDGGIASAEGLKSTNFAEVTKYSTNLHTAVPPTTFYAMNQNSWNKLPPDIQKVFEDNNLWMENELDKALIQVQQEAIDYAKAKGHEFYELLPGEQDKFNNLIKEIALDQAAKLDAKGLPGTKVFQETRRLIDEHNKK
jgi:TRAP-type transport system periplasmic protein